MKNNVSLHLLPPEILNRFKQVGNQVNINNPIIVARYVNPNLGLEWFAASYFPVAETFYGWMSGNDLDLGLFTLNELIEIVGYRDLTWQECRLSEVKSYVAS